MLSPANSQPITGQWTLPPLILHPFSGADAAEHLLTGSRANMMLQGIVPSAARDREGLEQQILRGRIEEVRMLYFLGKDVARWMEQCVDFADRTPELQHKGIRAQSFASFLVERTPESITRKLVTWGVSDHRSVFSRALGITTLLNAPPSLETVTPFFLQNYHRFLDYLFICFQNLTPFVELSAANFQLELYASAEYSQMLADQWSQ